MGFLGIFAAGTVFITRVGWPGWLLGLFGIVCVVGAVVMQAVKDHAKAADSSVITRQQSMRTTGGHTASGPPPSDVPSRTWGIHEALVEVPYIQRDAQTEVTVALAAGHPVLILGPSMAGKTRMAAHLVQELYPSRPVVIPDVPNGISTLMNAGEVPRDSVIWLDDAERYLADPKDLKAKWVDELRQAGNVIVATMRESAYERFQPEEQHPRTQWETIRCFNVIRLRNLQAERIRLASEVGDQRIREGILKYGLGTYVGGGFLAVERLETGRSTNPVGAALVLAAIDWQRSGVGDAIPASTAKNLLSNYVDEMDCLSDPDAESAGLSWATDKTVGGGAFRLLAPVRDGELRPFDYLVDYISGSGAPIPSPLWAAASETDASAGLLNGAGLVAAFAGEESFAFRFFQRASELGDPEAMANLGTCLERQDRISEAERMFARAADAGDPHGATGLGVTLMRRGEFGEAEELLRRAATAGSGDAMANLGFIASQRGETVIALDWYRRAAAAGSGLGMTNYGIQLEQAGQVVEAENLYRAAAARQNGAGMYQLAKLCYSRGQAEEAESLLQQAVLKGNPAAMTELAVALDSKGRHDEAHVLFHRAASRGDAFGLAVIGKRFIDGGDRQAARPLLTRSADLGSGLGMFFLGHLYELNGDKESAKEHYRRAAVTGHIEDIGSLLSLADRLEGDEVAYGLYRKAANSGSVYAIHRLSNLLRESGQTEESEALLEEALVAERGLEKAAHSGDVEAFVELGSISANRGEFGKAREHFMQAAARGNEFAVQCIEALPRD